MALLFIESFDHSDINHLGVKWSKQTSTPGLVSGRNTGYAWAADASGRLLTKNFNSNYSTLYVGFAWYCNSSRNITSPGAHVLQFYDGTTLQIFLGFTDTNKFTVSRQGTVLGTGTTIVPLNAWIYVELKIVFGTGTSGSIVLRLNQTTELNLTSINTAPSGNAYANSVAIGNPADYGYTSWIYQYFDDLYMLDSSGAKNNNFLGDVKVSALKPTGVGSSSQFTNSAGNSTNNYTYVDESSGTFPNDDTDYVADGTNGDRDSYVMSDVDTTIGNIYGSQTSAYARKDDAGPKQFNTYIRTSGTNYDDTAVYLSDTYNYYSAIREQNPNGNVDWDVTSINGLEAGVKVAS